MRDEVRREELQLADQRARQEAAEFELQKQLKETQELRAELDTDKALREHERKTFDERSKAMGSHARSNRWFLQRDRKELL